MTCNRSDSPFIAAIAGHVFPSFRQAVRGFVSRVSVHPNLTHVVHSGIRVGIRVAGRNRQNLNGRNAGFRGAFDFVDQEAIHLVDLTAVWTLHRDFTVQVVVVTRERFGPDHAETMLAIRAPKRIVWHWELLQ